MSDALRASRSWVVLVVDDEPDVRRYLSQLVALSFPGVQTLGAEHGKAALDIMSHNNVDLIVSDQRMPQMDGIEFLTLASQMAPDVPRVLLTGYADVDTAVRAVNAGHISAFFQKPAPPVEFIAELRRLLDSRESTIQRQMAFARGIDAARKRVAPFAGSLTSLTGAEK